MSAIEALREAGAGERSECQAVMKDVGKVLAFRARLPPAIMRPDDEEQSRRWLKQALDLSKRLKGRNHPGTKNVERLLGDDSEAGSDGRCLGGRQQARGRAKRPCCSRESLHR